MRDQVVHVPLKVHLAQEPVADGVVQAELYSCLRERHFSKDVLEEDIVADAAVLVAAELGGGYGVEDGEYSAGEGSREYGQRGLDLTRVSVEWIW